MAAKYPNPNRIVIPIVTIPRLRVRDSCNVVNVINTIARPEFFGYT